MVKLFDLLPVELKHEVAEYRKTLHKGDKKLNKSSKLAKSPSKKGKNFAFVKAKKLPLDTERQVKSAINDFGKVKSVSLEEKQEAYKKIINSANRYSICTMVLSSKFEHCLFNTDSKEPENN